MLASFFAPLDLPLTLAEARRGLTPEKQSEILFWSIVIVAVSVVLGIVGYLVYRQVKKANEPDGETAGFSLSEVRRLYEKGEVSHEEFVQVKERILAAARKSMAGDASMSRITPPAAPDATPPPGDGISPSPLIQPSPDETSPPASPTTDVDDVDPSE